MNTFLLGNLSATTKTLHTEPSKLLLGPILDNGQPTGLRLELLEMKDGWISALLNAQHTNLRSFDRPDAQAAAEAALSAVPATLANPNPRGRR